MTYLVSKNEKETLRLCSAKGFRLVDGDMLIISTAGEIDKAGEWLGKNGLSCVYFDPMEDIDSYKDFIFVSINDNDTVGIRLYN